MGNNKRISLRKGVNCCDMVTSRITFLGQISITRQVSDSMSASVRVKPLDTLKEASGHQLWRPKQVAKTKEQSFPDCSQVVLVPKPNQTISTVLRTRTKLKKNIKFQHTDGWQKHPLSAFILPKGLMTGTPCSLIHKAYGAIRDMLLVLLFWRSLSASLTY